MSAIRIVRGTGRGPTETAAYDAALADAGVHEYNLVCVSSVLPAGAPLEVTETAPDLGPPGHRLTVVQARASAASGTACAGLGWARAADGVGVVYEGAGADREAARRAVESGLAAGRALRDRRFTERGSRYACVDADATDDAVAAAVVLAVLGEGEPVIERP